jgi:hypothetical protein
MLDGKINLEIMLGWHVVTFIFILANGCQGIISGANGFYMYFLEFKGRT